jgi:cytochrome b subunit of formate dehydrogenase
MGIRRLAGWLIAGAIGWVGVALPGAVAVAADTAPLNDAGCLTCHDGGKGALTVVGANGKSRPMHVVAADKFGKSVHAKLRCVACHTDIIDNTSPHKKAQTPKADCAGCHQSIWDKIKTESGAGAQPGLGQVAQQIERYKLSVHARPNTDDKTRNNAVCADCHDSHTFVRHPEGSPERAAWRLTVPAACGTCHEDELAEYSSSIHGTTVLANKDPRGAICADCHNPHGVDNTSKDEVKLRIVGACSNCHSANAKSYVDTYHGQINRLGYANTAKCFDCHGSHGILSPRDPKSKVHPDNRLKTCQQCHKEATAGFVTYQPHAHAGDFKRYPQVWLTTKFMVGLLAGTFAFFWIHVALWLYRETKDRSEGKTRPLIQVDKLGLPPGKYFQRFGPWWRLGHLLFAVSLMLLTLTGMTLLYSGSSWAPVVMKLLGGPKAAAIIHRVNALIFTGVFIIHLIYIVIRLGRNWKTFKIFGPDSLIPGLQDLKDVIAMFKWFFGRGPRPFFDRWTYWEKFDYWAPFWGVAIVGISGFMMWYPNVTARFLPGWAFNVAVITHGEEAFLAAVFLFTVHFFNNHFRPEKFPLDVVMFTGSMSLEHFIRDHPLHYKRLVESGELQKYLVDAPSKPMALGSRVLGFTLIAFGLLLLVLIANGFWGSVTPG